MSVQILTGDVRTVLPGMAAESVHCVITSPPYFALRDYGVAGQLGLEETPEAYVASLVDVFREVRRVLRKDGTLWLNVGDSYASDGGRGAGGNAARMGRAHQQRNIRPGASYSGIKPKDLIGIPWMLAFALRADGWFLRQEIIWHKSNVTPGSAKDRCTTAHESLFLLAKQRHYYFDWKAIRERASTKTNPRMAMGKLVPGNWETGDGAHCPVARNTAGAHRKTRPKLAATPTNGAHRANPSFEAAISGNVLEWRMKRSVWRLPSSPFTEAHFATFPTQLVKPCILAGCPEGGTVLDPFFGAGTTGLVADRLQRSCIGIELNPAYAEMASQRIRRDAPMFAQVSDHPAGGTPGTTQGATAP